MKNILLVFLFSFFLSGISFCQLQVTGENNADTLASKLTGTGLTISNATLNCPAGACGTFNGANSNIGIGSGVLLTTGSVMNAVGPNLSSSISLSNGTTFNDPDLMAIDPNAINDVCILEFDAVTQCDTIYVKFVFGSDEYPEFVGSSYNDAFGIFVTGPNPSGPPYSGYNMTTIPSTTNPVSINNVNNGTACPTTGPCMNCSYYVDNCTIDSNSTVEYDGFTQLIFKSLVVTPSQSYHFKYAIADAGDYIFDSGVFFSLNSFACLPNSASDVLQPSASVNIFPNPFSQSAILKISENHYLPSQFKLLDVFGREVKTIDFEKGVAEQMLMRNNLSSGIYFYKLENDKKFISSGKLIIE